LPDPSAFTLAHVAPFILVGFAAQLVDGALGMAFGVISTTLLLSLGVPPAAASAGVQTVETFTTGVSAVSHAFHRNIDWRLFARIAVPGAIGGVIGATVLSHVHAAAARPIVLAYLAAIGLFLVWRAMRHTVEPKRPRVVEPLGLVGGFLDAAGGGGWGPVVTGNLLVQGLDPRRTIGTVNTAEFFVTAAASAAFVAALGWAAFTTATVGLLIGGVIAAPIGAVIARKAQARLLLASVGVLLTATSLFGIWSFVSG
jgi:uncharacterized membrane protein YfcA